jgi:hypothetical protein
MELVTNGHTKIITLMDLNMFGRIDKNGKTKWLNSCFNGVRMLLLPLKRAAKSKYFCESELVDYLHGWKNKVLAITIVM